MLLEVAAEGEALVADVTLVRLLSAVRLLVLHDVVTLPEILPAHIALKNIEILKLLSAKNEINQ
jgi:hypothetical protein